MFDHVPAELKNLPQWVLWKFEGQPGSKPSKVPYQTNGKRASTTSPKTWKAFPKALQELEKQRGQYNGLGFVFSGNDGLVGVDLDNCLDGAGNVLTWAQSFVKLLEPMAYLEVSPSGLGLKAWLKAQGPSKGQKIEVPGLEGSRVEVYPSGRFFAVTGKAWGQIRDYLPDGQGALENVLEWIGEQEGKGLEIQASQLEEPSRQLGLRVPNNLESLRGRPEAIERASLYLERCEPAIEGANGSGTTIAVCGAVAVGFDLAEEEAFQVLQDWNERCLPPWSDKDLRRKIREAIKTSKQPPGYLLEESELLGFASVEVEPVDLSGLQTVDLSAIAKPSPIAGPPLSLGQVKARFDEIGANPETYEGLASRIQSFNDMAIGWSLREELELASVPIVEETKLPSPLPGFLEEFTRWQLETAYKPQPTLAIMGSICCLATLIGRKVKLADRYQTRPNIQAICLGETGSGKDHARKCIQELFEKVGCLELLASDEPASDSGLCQELATASNGLLWMADEFGRFLATTNEAKSGHLYGIKSQLLKLFSNAGNSRYIPKAYVDSRKNIFIRYPFLVLMATSTPGAVIGSIKPSDVEEGLIGRMLMVMGSSKVKQRSPSRTNPPENLIHFARTWASYQPSGTMAQVSGGYELEVSLSPGAEALFEVFQVDCDKQQASGSVLWARATEKAKQLALVAACSKLRFDPWPPIVDEPEALWAIATVRAITSYMASLADMHLADSKREAQVKSVLRIIKEAGKVGLQRQQLYRRVKGLESRQLDEIAQYLVTSGEIEIQKPAGDASKRGRFPIVYRAV